MVARLSAEKDAQRSRAVMLDGDAELGQIGGRDAGEITRRGPGTLNLALGEERLEDRGRGQSRIARLAGQRHKHLGDRLYPVIQPQGLNYVGNLRIVLRVENSIAAADHGLMVATGVPGERDTGSEVVLVGFQASILRI